MALIQIVSPEEATGRVKEVYDKILKIAPVVPKPLQLVSSSPELLSMMFQSISYFLSNESLSKNLGGRSLCNVKMPDRLLVGIKFITFGDVAGY